MSMLIRIHQTYQTISNEIITIDECAVFVYRHAKPTTNNLELSKRLVKRQTDTTNGVHSMHKHIEMSNHISTRIVECERVLRV